MKRADGFKVGSIARHHNHDAVMTRPWRNGVAMVSLILMDVALRNAVGIRVIVYRPALHEMVVKDGAHHSHQKRRHHHNDGQTEDSRASHNDRPGARTRPAPSWLAQ
ncbi:MAG: hypothetical protein HW403_1220 [Dehalococcoidia bacterium]|nr:hypothetical protein [Dehalococcoidia bacterium]